MNATPCTIAVVTVNYRTPDLVIDCIDSVRALREELPGIRHFVVDNDSPDDSASRIAAHIDSNDLQSHVTFIDADRNGGYAYGNNLALREILNSLPEVRYVWLLNPDTRVYPRSCTALIDFLDNNPTAGMVGSRLEDADGTPQVSAFRFPSPTSEWLSTMRLGILDRLFGKALVPMSVRDEPHEAEWLAGASLMMRRDVVDDIGLMDERYFLYFEEVDYCLHTRRSGWSIWYVPESRVFHQVGAATGISDTRKKGPRRPQYWFDSRRRFFLKNFGAFRTLLSDLGAISGFALWRVRRFIQRKEDLDPPQFLGDLIRNSVFVRGFSIE